MLPVNPSFLLHFRHLLFFFFGLPSFCSGSDVEASDEVGFGSSVVEPSLLQTGLASDDF
jgi:hypothetical protein